MTREKIQKIIDQSEKTLKGKSEQCRLILISILAKGHVLIEDTPGLGKTTLAKYMALSLGMKSARIQFTNDLLPADILGSSVFRKETQDFELFKGPLFSEFIIADELNRASPKTQSALLQAMEERCISIEGKTYELPPYFTVIATQNPRSQIGTFDLPESQLDRFALKMAMGYTNKEATIAFLKENQEEASHHQESITPEDILLIQKEIESYHVEENLYELIYQLIEQSRQHKEIHPLSNRCGIDILQTAKANAFLSQRNYLIPDDIITLFPFVAGHRLLGAGVSDIELEHEAAKKILHEVL